jgi:isopentenyldiphosphate isomerase
MQRMENIRMELRDLYNSKRILTGEVIQKGQDVPLGSYYITVVVFIENNNGEFLLQKRVMKKDGKWATTGGHPVSGESSLEGIVTEIQEELGQNVKQNELTLFKTIMTEDDFVDLYYIVLQKEEVEDAKWATREEIEKLIEDDKFSKSHEEFYRYCLEFLEK